MRETMKNILTFILTCFLAGCAASPAIPISPSPITFEQEFNSKIYVEIHNTARHCIIRVWNPEYSEDNPQAIFRGSPGAEKCRIYNIVNPDTSIGDE